MRSACQKATTSSPRWLAYGSGQQCIDFEQVLPDRIPISQTAVVSSTLFRTRQSMGCEIHMLMTSRVAPFHDLSTSGRQDGCSSALLNAGRGERPRLVPLTLDFNSISHSAATCTRLAFWGCIRPPPPRFMKRTKAARLERYYTPVIV